MRSISWSSTAIRTSPSCPTSRWRCSPIETQDRGRQIAARQIAIDVGALGAGDAGPDYHSEILCFGDIGSHQGFPIYSDTWYGGQHSVLEIGHAPYAIKLAFKQMYFRTVGKPPSFGVPATHLLGHPSAD